MVLNFLICKIGILPSTLQGGSNVKQGDMYFSIGSSGKQPMKWSLEYMQFFGGVLLVTDNRGGSRVGQNHPLGHDAHLTSMEGKGRARQGEPQKVIQISLSLC